MPNCRNSVTNWTSGAVRDILKRVAALEALIVKQQPTVISLETLIDVRDDIFAAPQLHGALSAAAPCFVAAELAGGTFVGSLNAGAL